MSITGITVDSPVRFTADIADRTFTLLGNCNFSARTAIVHSDDDNFTGTLELDAFTLTAGQIRVGLSTNPLRHGKIVVGSGAVVGSGVLSIETAGSDVNSGTGYVTCTDLDQQAGTYNNGGTTTASGDYTIAAAATFNGLTGTFNLAGDYTATAGATLNWSTSDLVLNGSGTQTILFGGNAEPNNLCVNKPSGAVNFNDGPINGNSELIATSITATQTLNFAIAIPYSVKHLYSYGSGATITEFRSLTGGQQYTITVAFNSLSFHGNWQDANISGGIIRADTSNSVNAGNNTLSDGTTDGLLFEDINYPTDLDIFMRNTNALTIDRQGTQVSTLNVSPLYTNDDWKLEINCTQNGSVIDLTTATVTAAVVSDGNVALIAATVQSSLSVGADFPQGVVIVLFQASLTNITAQNAWLELQITDAGIVYTMPRERIQIIQGVIS
jgi:hypothetical protein